MPEREEGNLESGSGFRAYIAEFVVVAITLVLLIIGVGSQIL